MSGRSLIYGWGINDAGYVVEDKIRIGADRKVQYLSICPFYKKWAGMIRRCRSTAFQERNPTYVGVRASEEWRRFSVFKEWMQGQPWEGNELDKDLLGAGDLYSPDTCCFVHKDINGFFANCTPSTGKLLGVSPYNKSGKYRSQGLKNGKRYNIGVYPTQIEAHEAWLAYKSGCLEALIAKHLVPPKVESALRMKMAALAQQVTKHD